MLRTEGNGRPAGQQIFDSSPKLFRKDKNQNKSQNKNTPHDQMVKGNDYLACWQRYGNTETLMHWYREPKVLEQLQISTEHISGSKFLCPGERGTFLHT